MAARRGISTWGLGLGTGLLLAMCPGGVVLGGLLLLPGGLACLIDPTPGKSAGRPVLLCGAATAIAPAAAWWMAGPDIANALAIATSPDRLALAWCVQSLAWLGVEALPALIRTALNAAASTRMATLRRTRAGLEAEWSIPPSEPAPDDGTRAEPAPARG